MSHLVEAQALRCCCTSVCQSELSTTSTLPWSQHRPTMFRSRPACSTPISCAQSFSKQRGSRATAGVYTRRSPYGACCEVPRGSRPGALVPPSPRIGSRRRKIHRLHRLKNRRQSATTIQIWTTASWLLTQCSVVLGVLGAMHHIGDAGTCSRLQSNNNAGWRNRGMTNVMLYAIILCVGCGLPTVTAVENGATAIVIGRSVTKGNIKNNIQKLIKSL